MEFSDEAANHQRDKQQAVFRLNFDELDEATTYSMPSPFCDEDFREQGIEHERTESIDVSSPNSLGQITIIPTPPPERSCSSPDSMHSSRSHGSCVSPQHSASATSDCYIKGSSLEESPISSPSSSCAGENDSHDALQNGTANSVKRESCMHGTGEETGLSTSNGEADGNNRTHDQSVPKNIKLPQRKGGMQLWQFLYALLNDPDKKYRKLIEWTANNLSREFRLLEPEAIAIWWGEHKNKKNMSYDKLSRSLRYYYDKGIIRKISGERYVYQFCIDPELMYKHIGNSDSRPKLKPMPQSAYHATTEYQSQHGFTATSLLSKDSCYVAQGPMSLGIMHGHLVPSRSAYPPPPGYHNGFVSHGYTDINADLHNPHPHLGAYSSAFFPSSCYDNISSLPHMTASLGYTPMEPPLSLKAQLPPLRKSNSYEMPSLTPVTLKYDNETSYAKASLLNNSSLSPMSHLKYESDTSFGKSPMLHSSANSQNVILSSNNLSPPPLTSNRIPSPTCITPSFQNQESPPPPHSYSNHSSPHTYSGPSEDHLAFDEMMAFSSADEYPSNNNYQVAYSTHNSSNISQNSATANPWEEL